jgi:DNA modification methylase
MKKFTSYFNKEDSSPQKLKNDEETDKVDSLSADLVKLKVDTQNDSSSDDSSYIQRYKNSNRDNSSSDESLTPRPLRSLSSTDSEEEEFELKTNFVKDEDSKVCFENTDGISYMKQIDDGSIDLILTDPPYIISHESASNERHKKIKEMKENNVEYMKTEEEWEEYRVKYNVENSEKKKINYMKFGSPYGSMYSQQSDFGEWDKTFTMEDLDRIVEQYYKKLRDGGSVIIFFDIWKISYLKEMLEKHKFKQIRLIEWLKTNPVPINSSKFYLANPREIALVGVKGSKPTFNSKFDNGVYRYGIQNGKKRFHPTQKSLALFEDLVKKHTNEGDTVMDTFLGSGTTAFACRNTNRKFFGCELSKEYYDKTLSLFNEGKEPQKTPTKDANKKLIPKTV